MQVLAVLRLLLLGLHGWLVGSNWNPLQFLGESDLHLNVPKEQPHLAVDDLTGYEQALAPLSLAIVEGALGEQGLLDVGLVDLDLGTRLVVGVVGQVQLVGQVQYRLFETALVAVADLLQMQIQVSDNVELSLEF